MPLLIAAILTAMLATSTWPALRQALRPRAREDRARRCQEGRCLPLSIAVTLTAMLPPPVCCVPIPDEDQLKVPMLPSEPVANPRVAAMTRGDLMNLNNFDLAYNYK